MRAHPPHEGEGHRRPDRTVGVLAAVLAHTGNVAFDIPGLTGDLSKGGSNSTTSPVVAVDKAPIHGLHRLARARRVAGAADHRPALRQ